MKKIGNKMKTKCIYHVLLVPVLFDLSCIMINSERLMIGNQCLNGHVFKPVRTVVFEKLSEPKTVNRQNTGCLKVRRRYRRFRP